MLLFLTRRVLALRHDQSPPRPRTKPRLRSSSVGARDACDFGAGDASCMKSSQSDSGMSATSRRKASKPADLFTWPGVVCLFQRTPLEASPAAIGLASVLPDALETRMRALQRHGRRRVRIRGGAGARSEEHTSELQSLRHL